MDYLYSGVILLYYFLRQSPLKIFIQFLFFLNIHGVARGEPYKCELPFPSEKNTKCILILIEEKGMG